MPLLSGLGRGVLCTGKLNFANKPELKDQLHNPYASKLFEHEIYGDCIWFYVKTNAWLYEMLRPEFVMTYKTPLSPDAYSAFGAHNRHIHNREVKHLLKSDVVMKDDVDCLNTQPYITG